MLEYIESADFDRVLVETVTTTFPPHEHEQFVAHFRGLLGAWASDERRRIRVALRPAVGRWRTPATTQRRTSGSCPLAARIE